MSEPRSQAPRRGLLGAQGAYYVLTGAWAVAHRKSFEAVSGPKRDYWLVRTVGALTTAVGVALLLGSRAAAPDRTARTLATGSAAAFAAVDAVYAGTGRISRVYLADLAAQLAFLALAPLSAGRTSRGSEGLVHTTVLVDGESVETTLRERPPVGAKLDVGFTVLVTESKEVDGGYLVAADRIDDEVPAR